MRWFCCLTVLALALTAAAHPVLQDAMWVRFDPSLVRVAVNVSVREICVAQNIPVHPGTSPDAQVLDRAAGQEGDYLLRHLRFSAGTASLRGKFVRFTRPAEAAEPEQTFYQYELEYQLNGPPPAEVTIVNDMLEDHPYAPGTAWDVSYVLRARSFNADSATTWLLRHRQPATIPTGWEGPPAAPASAAKGQHWRTFCDYLWHGVRHILTGWDHLLFVAALVIAAKSAWEMVKVVAAFTLAHTLTLALCVFGIFRLPSAVVEPLIAASIIFVAAENLIRPERTHSWMRIGVAFGFGLIHGLGFAGGLLDAMAGLPAIGTWLALGAFSLGVEAGHQIVVLPLFALVALGRHKLPASALATMLRCGTSAISVGGAWYLLVAVHEQYLSR